MISARTAPKAKGEDDLFTALVLGKEKEVLAREMEKTGEERKAERFKRDAGNVRDSYAVVLLGIRGTKTLGLNCGACGFATCEEYGRAPKKTGPDFVGPLCHLKLMDLGVALGSAVKTASDLNVDNRVMYQIGAAARRLKMLPEADVIYGIPISAKGKNIYFDRKPLTQK